MDDKKIYCGNGRQIKGEYGVFRSVSICLDDIPEEHITKSEKNGKSYVELNIFDMNEKNQWGNDVYATVGTWKKDPNYKKSTDIPPESERKEESIDESTDDENSLPF